MVEIVEVVGDSRTKVGDVSEQCRENIPREGSSKSDAVMPMPLTCFSNLARYMCKSRLPQARILNT